MNAIQALENASFEFSDFWQVAGVSKTLAQNWTSDRPLKIWPSIATADGKGGRNIYSIYDAYLLAYLHLARAKGLATDALARVLSLLTMSTTTDSDPLKKYFQRSWLAVSVSKMVVMTINVRSSDDGRQLLTDPLQLSDFHDDAAVLIAVNLTKLRDAVNARANKILSKRKIR